ncbi:MAG TPA: ABC transporter permease [Humisphaera sp.]
MYRTLVIARHTFREAVVQPIYSLLLGLGAAILIVFSLLPFFTLGEDTVMFKSVALDVILLMVLLTTLFATSRTIYDEIEDRTMLTLMSKPVRKWEVLVGKYLGIVVAALGQVLALGFVMIAGLCYRIPIDGMLGGSTLNDAVAKQILELRLMHSAGVVPSLMLVWLQVCVLAAVGVALSVRFSLVVNLPAVLLLYVAGNLTRFLGTADASQSWFAKAVGSVVSTVVPFLQVFDFRQHTIHREVAMPWTEFVDPTKHPFATGMGMIWGYVAVALLYGVCYAAFALGSGLVLFENRELGGNEG